MPVVGPRHPPTTDLTVHPGRATESASVARRATWIPGIASLSPGLRLTDPRPDRAIVSHRMVQPRRGRGL